MDCSSYGQFIDGVFVNSRASNRSHRPKCLQMFITSSTTCVITNISISYPVDSLTGIDIERVKIPTPRPSGPQEWECGWASPGVGRAPALVRAFVRGRERVASEGPLTTSVTSIVRMALAGVSPLPTQFMSVSFRLLPSK